MEESISTAELTEVTVKKETEGQEVTLTEPEPIASTQRELPENIEKLVSFMEETGGNIQDYMRLNTNYDDVDKNVLVKERLILLSKITFHSTKRWMRKEISAKRKLRIKKRSLKQKRF